MKNLKELINTIKNHQSKYALPDDYLAEKGCSTREDNKIGEYIYGMTHILADEILPYLEELRDLKSL